MTIRSADKRSGDFQERGSVRVLGLTNSVEVQRLAPELVDYPDYPKLVDYPELVD